MLIPWSPQSAKIATKSNRDWVLNAKPVLLLHLDGADAAVTTKDSGGTGHTVTFGGTAQLDTAQKKWGSSSLLLDGDSDYLTIADHANWDISTNWTVDLWLNCDAVAGTYRLIEQYEDASNHWHITLYARTLFFQVISLDTAIVSLAAAGTVTTATWYHVALCKVGNLYGMYQDGTQISYVSDADTDTFAGILVIGRHGDASHYFDGHMDEIRIVPGNPFGALPNAGKTNTIKVPFRPYISWG